MKSIFLSLTILLSTTFLFSQEEATNTDDDKMSLGFAVNFIKITLNSDDEDFEISDRIGYSIEGSFYYQLKPRLMFKAGLNISGFEFDITDYSLIFGSDIVNGMVDQRRSYVRSRMEWGYIGMPVELQFQIPSNKYRFYLKGGVEFLYNLFENEKSEISESGSIKDTSPAFSKIPNKSLGLITIGFGMEVKLSKKINFYLEPNFELGINDVIKSDGSILQEEPKSRIRNIGAKVGIRF